MKLSINSSAADAISALRARLTGNRFWSSRLDELARRTNPMERPRIHLAVFVEPYLQYVFDGVKTVESRFSINRCAPFEKAKKGDIVLLKRSGGGIIGICEISTSWYYNLDEESWTKIREEFAGPLAISDQSFWRKKQRACYASLFKISHVYQFDDLPFDKRDRRGWVVLNNAREEQRYILST